MRALADNPHVTPEEFAAVCDAHLSASQALFERIDQGEAEIARLETLVGIAISHIPASRYAAFVERTKLLRVNVPAFVCDVDETGGQT